MKVLSILGFAGNGATLSVGELELTFGVKLNG